MTGLELLNALPVLTLAAIVIGGSVIFRVGLQLLVRWRLGVEFIASNHEVAGFKYAVVGVAYSVLLAFVVVGVWEQYEDTDDAAQAEAERFYNLFRHSYNYTPDAGEKIRRTLMDYAGSVRDDDWPEMDKGHRGSEKAAAAYAKLSFIVGRTKSPDIAMLPTVLHGINLMKEMADFWLERLSDVGVHMTSVIWGVLILGGLITLAYPAFFATYKVAPQMLMTAGLAKIVGAIFFLTINLNFPFADPAHIKPEAIDALIQRVETEEPLHGV